MARRHRLLAVANLILAAMALLIAQVDSQLATGLDTEPVSMLAEAASNAPVYPIGIW